MLELLYGAGLRVSECAALDLEALRWDGGHLLVRVVSGKGGKDRLVPAGRSAAAATRAWLDVRERWIRPGAPPQALFYGVRGGRFSPRSIRAMVARVCEASGTRAVIGPHGLRHNFATHLLQSGRDLRSIQHARARGLSSTQVYTHLDVGASLTSTTRRTRASTSETAAGLVCEGVGIVRQPSGRTLALSGRDARPRGARHQHRHVEAPGGRRGVPVSVRVQDMSGSSR